MAVSSNSHKAINNLLRGVEEVLLKQGQRNVRAAKKCSRGDDSTRLNGQDIVDVDENEVALDDHWQLVAGTAWLLARPEADQQFDYLFVDEAGQVSLANLAAMGACARNIVLLGDQMQLGQPIQGVHPGRSGESSLEYLLDGHATVPPERGVFLPITWRLCPDVCRFISDAVYDGRLFPEEMNAHQRLVLGAKPHPALQPTGLVFWRMDHTGCGQKSPEEADEIERIYQSLLNVVDRPQRQEAAHHAGRHPSRRALQPAGEPVEARAARHRARRDGGQVPGPGGGGVADLDDDLKRGRPAPPPRVPVQQEQTERGYFKSQMFERGGGESEAVGYAVPDTGGDCVGEYALLGGGMRCRPLAWVNIRPQSYPNQRNS